MKNSILLGAAAWLLCTSLWALEPKEQFPIWEGIAPGETAAPQPELVEPNKQNLLRVKRVDTPTLAFYPAPDPAKGKNGTTVLIFPGGGYHGLATDHEGVQVAEWLNKHGVHAAVLKYRVPRRPNREPWEAPLEDARQALKIIREKASDWGVSPDRIGVLGFSAGGDLASRVLCQKDPEGATPSPRPNFAVLVYPAYLLGEKGDGEFNPLLEITKDTPPTFLVHSHDDPITSLGSAEFYLRMRKAGAKSELHIFANGGHGWGMNAGDQPFNRWPERAAEWLKVQGLIE